jgi:hypothetical protein
MAQPRSGQDNPDKDQRPTFGTSGPLRPERKSSLVPQKGGEVKGARLDRRTTCVAHIFEAGGNAYVGVGEMGDSQRRGFHEAPLEADAFDDLGKAVPPRGHPAARLARLPAPQA